MNSFGERLKSLRLSQNRTQQSMASLLGVTSVAIRNWEQGVKKPSMDALIAIGDKMGVSIDELLGLPSASAPIGMILNAQERRLIADYQELDRYGQKAVESICAIEKERVTALRRSAKNKVIEITSRTKSHTRFIPHYTTPSAAGINAPIDGAEYERMLADDTVPANADYAVDIQGNSMEPYIHDGDTVFVERDAELAVGDVGIFCVDGAMYCKQYYIDDDGNCTLVSANPELRHTNIQIAADSGSSCTVCGKVLIGRRLELPDYLFYGTET